MKADIDDLFEFLRCDDLARLEAALDRQLVNQYRRKQFDQPDYSGARKLVLYTEISKELLLFEAVRLKSYDGFRLLLKKGADLFAVEKWRRITNVEDNGRVRSYSAAKETDIALTFIENFGDLEIIQITFDHICAQRFILNSEHVDFLVDHLDKVDLSNFKLEYLNIDVGHDMPERFETEREYKEFLQMLGFDVSRLFFYPSEYLEYLLNPLNQFDAKFLKHALDVCRFTLEQKKQLYRALPTQELKAVVEGHTPEVNVEFLEELLRVCEAVEEKNRSPVLSKKNQRESSPDVPVHVVPQESEEAGSPGISEFELSEKKQRLEKNGVKSKGVTVAPGVPNPNGMFGSKPITEVDRKEYDGLIKKMAEIEDIIHGLEQKKSSAKVKKDLQHAKFRLEKCKNDLEWNLVYRQNKSHANKEGLHLSHFN